MRHARLRNILAAAALTGLVLATILAFAWQSAPPDAQPVTTEVPTAGALRAENQQLRQAVNTLQQREAAYQGQIEAANQTILQLQAAGGSRFQDDDRHESQSEEHEHEENEFAEHEGQFGDD